jgi:tRNA (cytidine/uridine-2'-O-)-methyltransferase
MFHVVLVEPEIPPNTGNIIRLCANTGAQLHLVEPLGFPLDDAKMRRAGLDYHDYATMKVHKNWNAFLADAKPDPTRMFAMTTHGSAPFADVAFRPGDVFVFGAESRGLDPALRESFCGRRRLRGVAAERVRGRRLKNQPNCRIFATSLVVDRSCAKSMATALPPYPITALPSGISSMT